MATNIVVSCLPCNITARAKNYFLFWSAIQIGCFKGGGNCMINKQVAYDSERETTKYSVTSNNKQGHNNNNNNSNNDNNINNKIISFRGL